MPDRAQLSTTLLEAAIATALILGVTTLVLLTGGPAPEPTGDRTVDRYATDVGRLLTAAPGHPPIRRVVATNHSYHLHRDAVESLVQSAVPPGYFYRVETRFGSLGSPKPSHIDAGHTTLETTNGTVSVWVWAP